MVRIEENVDINRPVDIVFAYTTDAFHELENDDFDCD